MNRWNLHRSAEASTLCYSSSPVPGLGFGAICFPSDDTALVDYVPDDFARLGIIETVLASVNGDFTDVDRENLATVGDLLDLAEARGRHPSASDQLSAFVRAFSRPEQAHA